MISTLLVAAALLAADPQPATSALTVKVGRQETKVRVLAEEKKTILDVVSPHGIDKATVTRTADNWPSPLLVRLHLKGLESFKAVTTADKIDWSVSSSTGYSHRNGEKFEGGIWDLAGNHFKGKLRIINSEKKIPLAEGGYFEVWLPVKLFKDNPPELKLSWIDFYR